MPHVVVCPKQDKLREMHLHVLQRVAGALWGCLSAHCRRTLRLGPSVSMSEASINFRDDEFTRLFTSAPESRNATLTCSVSVSACTLEPDALRFISSFSLGVP